MALEHAAQQIVRKPWGSDDLRPWSALHDELGPIGEIWFQRADPDALPTALLLKLLFTTARLSIQVHPDDAYAKAHGLANGKTEAWYILSAAAGGEVALGLKRPLTTAQLRQSIEDRSIEGLVKWRDVHEDDTISVPAGTIHGIGAGLVVAEIQQRSDTTFRIFDYGRSRPLQVDDAVAVADTGPVAEAVAAYCLTDVRTLLATSPYFVFERIDLPPNSHWRIDAEQETWLLVLHGQARLGPLSASIGEAFFLEDDRAPIDVGGDGLTALVAYSGTEPGAGLLLDLDWPIGSLPTDLNLRPSASVPGAAIQPMEAQL